MNDHVRDWVARIAGSLTLVGVLGWLAAFTFFVQLQERSPAVAVPESAQTEEMVGKGRPFFVTAGEKVTFYALLWGSGILATVGVAVRVAARPLRPVPVDGTGERT